MLTMVDSEINQHLSVFELKVLYNFKMTVTLKKFQPMMSVTQKKVKKINNSFKQSNNTK